MKSTYLDTSEAHLYYEVVGHGTPVLMLHGNSQSHHVFHSYKRNLQKSYQVILMDSRAHGRSRIKPGDADAEFTTADMAKDAAALLDVLRIPSCILFGFSDGANIALEFASLFPERTLSVIAVSGNITPDGLILPVRLFCIGKYYFYRILSTLFRTVSRLTMAPRRRPMVSASGTWSAWS